MKIHVFGVHHSFGINRVGGTDSFYRRLAREWIEQGHEVHFVHYRCGQTQTAEGWFGIQVHEFDTFQEALSHLETEAEVVVVNTLHRNDRLAFARFRHRWSDRIKFFIVYSLFRENPIWRHVYFLESIVYPYQSGTWCMSPRITRLLERWRLKPELVWPPVARNFYCPPQRKPRAEKIRVTYIGRTESGKGIEEVIKTVSTLRHDPRFELTVHGYFFPGDAEGARRAQWLQSQSWLDYHHQEIQDWSPHTDERLAELLHRTDILLLPYGKLSSLIDTPLLLVEGMAAGCCIMTRPLGDIPTVYGQSPLLIRQPDFAEEAIRLLRTVDDWLEPERQRVARQALSLGCDADSVSRKVLQLMAN